MRLGGNTNCIEFLKKYNIPKSMPIAQKYNTPAATLYRDRIEAAANGRPLPTELPALKLGSSASSGVQQGTDPLEGETEAQYVARQRKLQEEVQCCFFVLSLHALSCTTPHRRRSITQRYYHFTAGQGTNASEIR
jgi:hypothetical protein